jgi:serine/threonine-protein kinase
VTDDWPARGTVLAGRYRLGALLGVGGMSSVWRARDDVLGRDVAVKLLAGPLTADVRLRALIGREARAVAGLSHPNIVAVHDYGEAVRPDQAVLPFVVMELIDGEPLQARLDRAPLPWRDAVRVCAEVAAALTAAHRHGLVHRDVHPGNILCAADGAKVVDFGIAAAVGEPDEDATGVLFGTLEYVAPERLDGRPADAATDVFALGVLLFELVSGRAPFPATSWEEVAAAHEAGPPAPPAELPAALAALCAACLALDPAARPGADEVADALRRALAPLVPSQPRRTVELPAPSHQRALRVVAVAAVVAGAAAAVAVLPFAARPFRAPEQPVTVVAPPPAAPPPVSPSPAPAPPPSAAPVDAADPVEAFDGLVQAGVSRGDLRPDVATDLRNLLGSLERAAPGDASARVEELRRKIDDRQREGSLTRPLARQLRDALSALR